MEHPPLTGDLTVAEVLARWPQAVQVFFRHRMACVGCTMAPFDTIADVTAIYGLPMNCFLSELQQAIQTREARL
ncbi:MAG: DUF1858 domain-containing protein [Anaerolineae bacterium]|nr:DUF1858 domain-containing protein [Anaerolineae bacterium]MDW8098657.1 DUF1858 domain-containing protein [Anaerolineae bacterium]